MATGKGDLVRLLQCQWGTQPTHPRRPHPRAQPSEKHPFGDRNPADRGSRCRFAHSSWNSTSPLSPPPQRPSRSFPKK